jgi:hypothetical protein
MYLGTVELKHGLGALAVTCLVVSFFCNQVMTTLNGVIPGNTEIWFMSKISRSIHRVYLYHPQVE